MEKNVNTPHDNDYKNSLRIEYVATQDAVLHYDNFVWQVGSILIAGTFVFWGLIVGKTLCPQILGIGALLVTLLLSAWFLYGHNCRQIYLLKLHRIREIEKELCMEQHRRFEKESSTEIHYERYPPRGLCFDRAIYLTTSLGTLVIAFLKIGHYGMLLGLSLLGLSLIVIIAVFIWGYKNERKLQKQLNGLKQMAREKPKEDTHGSES